MPSDFLTAYESLQESFSLDQAFLQYRPDIDQVAMLYQYLLDSESVETISSRLKELISSRVLTASDIGYVIVDIDIRSRIVEQIESEAFCDPTSICGAIDGIFQIQESTTLPAYAGVASLRDLGTQLYLNAIEFCVDLEEYGAATELVGAIERLPTTLDTTRQCLERIQASLSAQIPEFQRAVRSCQEVLLLREAGIQLDELVAAKKSRRPAASKV